ncbi:MAG: tRNA guanosine(34) transglycosylase Tgt [Chloroflexota bacterium]
MSFNFVVDAIDEKTGARACSYNTHHGTIKTPVFAPVGTAATVKALSPRDLQEIGATLVLANTYHLRLRPGDELIRDLGGLHKFMAWDQPILTDSGGYQVFSLTKSRKVDENGVTFRSHIDGSEHEFTPELAMRFQENLGADIIMCFDECAPPYDREYSKAAMIRTHKWAERCLLAKTRSDQALFGIVQGGIFDDLRSESAQHLKDLGFGGYAIGGLSVGEKKSEMYQVTASVCTVLPYDAPRYLMGVGTPEDLVQCVLRGVDIFDCVLPTRLGRNGAALVHGGRINLRNSKWKNSGDPISQSCSCYTCSHFCAAYLRHLTNTNEILGHHLISLHNVHFLIDLTKQMRSAIVGQRFKQFADDYLRAYPEDVFQ